MTFGDRLNLLIKTLGSKSVTSFEDKVGVTRKIFAKVIRVGTDTGYKNLQKIWEIYPEVNLHWLLTGEGEMLLNPRSTTAYSNTLPDARLAEPAASYNQDEYIQSLKDQIVILKDQVTILKEESANKQSLLDMIKRGDIIINPSREE
ncbi:hypothetical protein [Dysgonomonas macrotermitis]|uniref:Bacteriophage CI repressor helix-turn-helix domain-containing protein n=1 Tax=Dysgonomonas macrotermitis TaxID=1346286 RepID=A0A1M5CFH6_9BACT|nr:hypothetical protein [Dysgonomonas macrotermitis]SHF53426.1 hypothetical protein SAMN05444362_107151 [Dysgonomonas macrotermitis]